MKREIKFRAWDGKQMYIPTSLLNDPIQCGYEDGSGCPKYRDDKVMQYTGLKDKNGKEIYEGDILAVENEGDVITVCKWDIGGFTLEDNAGGHWTRQLFNQPDRLEIIGNIHENSELLKK